MLTLLASSARADGSWRSSVEAGALVDTNVSLGLPTLAADTPAAVTASAGSPKQTTSVGYGAFALAFSRTGRMALRATWSTDGRLPFATAYTDYTRLRNTGSVTALTTQHGLTFGADVQLSDLRGPTPEAIYAYTAAGASGLVELGDTHSRLRISAGGRMLDAAIDDAWSWQAPTLRAAWTHQWSRRDVFWEVAVHATGEARRFDGLAWIDACTVTNRPPCLRQAPDVRTDAVTVVALEWLRSADWLFDGGFALESTRSNSAGVTSRRTRMHASSAFPIGRKWTAHGRVDLVLQQGGDRVADLIEEATGGIARSSVAIRLARTISRRLTLDLRATSWFTLDGVSYRRDLLSFGLLWRSHTDEEK